MSGPRYDLVPHIGPEATPRPPEPEPEPARPEHGYPADVGGLMRPGKILLAAMAALIAGVTIASGASSSADKIVDCHYLRVQR